MDFSKPISVGNSVQVAVNIRPLIGSELLQGCRDCINVIPGEPQLQLGTHCFTFDHAYGSPDSPSSNIFKDCVAPLVEGLFYGYNATVLAYGQTGSGKTYTMGTGYTPGGNNGGVIPQVMETIFNKVNSFDDKVQFHIRVSFIEILKEEIHDLLDTSVPKAEVFNTSGVKTPVQGRPAIQIRENTAGGITLAGSTEIDVRSLQEMASCLAQGSLSRATGSTNMNSHSSRSHAIFTISLEKRTKMSGETHSLDDACDEVLCGKLHLVDLAGSERAKRTGTDGMRFKEGVHINKGLLALGNVINALAEDKKRKEARHVPYRDSKLTRLLQDSLGGNSRTVMIACVSPADSNAEETLNTLKYASRARNIQNKPIVNRDPIGTEMQKLRQQLNLLQAELIFARTNECSAEVLEVLKQKLSCVETTNETLRRELRESQESCRNLYQSSLDAQMERDELLLRVEQLHHRKGATESEGAAQSYLAKIHDLEAQLQQLRTSCSQCVEPSGCYPDVSCANMENYNSSMTSATGGPCSDVVDENHLLDASFYSVPSNEVEADAVTADELKHHLFVRDCMDKELHELNRQLKEKEGEMRNYSVSHLERKLIELEEEKKSLQMEKNTLSAELEALLSSSDEHTKKIQHSYVQKLKDLETQISDLKRQQDKQAQLLRSKQRSDEAAERLQNDIHRIKHQKVLLQNRIKQESEHFRTWKACREKELLQLRKEGRRNEYEMHKLQALHERQKLVLHRKTEEAAAVSRRLKEVLEARKSAARENSSSAGPPAKHNTKTFQQWFDQELEHAVRLREARIAYEKQNVLQETLVKEEDTSQALNSGNVTPRQDAPPSPCDTEAPSMSSFLNGRADSFERSVSTAITSSTSQALDAEEEQYKARGPIRWQQVRTLGDARDLLNFVFNVAACARCQLREVENKNKDFKERIDLLNYQLRQAECHRKELEHLMTASKDDRQGDELLQLRVLDAMQLCYEENESTLSNSENDHLAYECHGTETNHENTGRLRKWKGSQQRWSLQFKWKWQKPWRLAQWIRQNDKAISPSNALRVLDMI